MTQPVQSFNRGLLILAYLNTHNGSNANAVARGTRLTRGTTFRLLETLRQSNFIRRDETSGQYWLELKVRTLADGYSDETWIDDIARPKIQELSANLVWPLTLSTPSGIYMLIRLNTDFESPLSQNRFHTGHRVPIVDSASGMVFLCHCDESQRHTLLEMATKAGQVAPNSDFSTAKKTARCVGNIQKAGYAIRSEKKRSVVSVPIFSDSRIFACLAMRFYTSALKERQIHNDILPSLKAAAKSIGDEFQESRP